MAADPLFAVKNAFHLGNYQACIAEAQKCRPTTDEDRTLRDCFLYRSYIAQGKSQIALDEIKASSDEYLLAVRLLAEYMASPHKRPSIVESLESKSDANDMYFLMAALIYMKENNMDNALRMLHNTDCLEGRALAIQCLLKIHRVDLAAKELKKLQELDEDATVTQMALAWTNIYLGKEKLQDAFYIFGEMIDKYGQTPLLLNAQACTLIMQAKHEQADELLQEALQRDANCAEALVNMIVVSQQLGKPLEQCNRYINQLKQSHPQHPWTKDFTAVELKFDQVLTESAA